MYFENENGEETRVSEKTVATVRVIQILRLRITNYFWHLKTCLKHSLYLLTGGNPTEKKWYFVVMTFWCLR